MTPGLIMEMMPRQALLSGARLAFFPEKSSPWSVCGYASFFDGLCALTLNISSVVISCHPWLGRIFDVVVVEACKKYAPTPSANCASGKNAIGIHKLLWAMQYI